MSPAKEPRRLSKLIQNLAIRSADIVRWIAVAILVVICGLSAGDGQAAETTLVSAGSTWKYLDNGSDQGTAWRATPFGDSDWASGSAQWRRSR